MRPCAVLFWTAFPMPLRAGACRLLGLETCVTGPSQAAYPKRILLTGGSGTLGFNIVRMFASRYKRARITVLLRPTQCNLFSDLPNVATRLIQVTDNSDVQRAVSEEEPDAIVHCAASGMRPSDSTWFDMVKINVDVALNLLAASAALAQCHFIHISTGMAYRVQNRALLESDPIDPSHLYGVTKAASDMLLRSGAERLQRRLTVVRPFSFTGSHDFGERLFPSLLRCAQMGEPLEMSAGTQIRDFCAVQDVARAVCLILERTGGHGVDIYNVGSGRAVPLKQLVEEVCDELALNVDIRFGLREPARLEPMHLVANISKIRGIGWSPQQTLSESVRDLALERYPGLLLRKSARAHG